jgi:hypothetical protein
MTRTHEDTRQATGGSGRPAFPHAFLTVSTTLYLILAVSVLTTSATLPVWALALLTDVTVTWFPLALSLPLTAPALFAACATFRGHAEGEFAVIRPWARAWVRGVRRAGPFGLGLAALLVVLAADVLVVAGKAVAALALPGLAVVAAVGLVTFVTAVAAAEEFPDLTRFVTLKAALACSVRSLGWSLVTLVVLAVYGALLLGVPGWALGIATAPVLYVTWANARRALAPLRRGPVLEGARA